MSAYTDSEGNVALMLTKAEAGALKRLLYYRVSGCPDGDRAHLSTISNMLGTGWPSDPRCTGEVVYTCDHPEHQWYQRYMNTKAVRDRGVRRG